MAIPTDIDDLSTTPASNSPDGSEAPSVLDDHIRSAYAIIKQNASKGSDIASSGTITIPAAGSYFDITGTTTITAISDTNTWDGRQVTLQFDDALTLTHASSFVLPGAADITTAAGDVAMFVRQSSGNWRCTNYMDVSPVSELTTVPAFSFKPTSNQTVVTPSSWTYIVFGTENFDTDNYFASSTFTPTVAGWYQLNAFVRTNASSGMTAASIRFRKNGSSTLAQTYGGLSGLNCYSYLSDIVYLDGDDGVQVEVNINGTGTLTVQANETGFSGHLVRTE